MWCVNLKRVSVRSMYLTARSIYRSICLLFSFSVVIIQIIFFRGVSSFHLVTSLHYYWRRAQQRVNKQVKTALCKCVIACHYLTSHQFCTLSIFFCKRKNLSKWSYWIGYIKGLCYVFNSHLPVKRVHLTGILVNLSVFFIFYFIKCLFYFILFFILQWTT